MFMVLWCSDDLPSPTDVWCSADDGRERQQQLVLLVVMYNDFQSVVLCGVVKLGV